MKVRESGMPDAGTWHTFFDPEAILNAMGLTAGVRDAVDFGCGHGTFAIPAAKRIQGTLHGFDIDPAMIEASRRLVRQENLRNVRLCLRDFVTDGTALEAASVDYVMLFNILHAEEPLRLLREAYRILVPGGRVGVIHWNYDPKTPRGPPMAIRPRPADCRQWLREAGFVIEKDHIDLPPYHYGIVARKKLKVLFLCTGNSCRSQMAEGWARALKGDVIETHSAGIEAHGLNPSAVKVMAEAGVDIGGQRSKSVDAVKDVPFDYVVTVCGHANETCPMWLSGKARVIHVGFDDPPALAKGAKSEGEALAHYRRVRDEIRDFIKTLPGGLTKA